MREIIDAEKAMFGVEPTLNVPLGKDFWCTQNYKDTFGYKIIIGMHPNYSKCITALSLFSLFLSSENTGNSIFGYHNVLIKTKYVQHC